MTGNDKTYLPWTMTPNEKSKIFSDSATKGDNFRDNIERIDAGNIPAGKYAVSVTHKGELQSLKQDFSLVINGAIDKKVSVNTPEYNSKINVFPNPAQNVINIHLPNEIMYGDSRIKLYNIAGQLVYRKIYNSDKIEINIAGLERGFYLIRIENQQGIITKQVILE